jgi:hypothetical protein
MTATELRSQGAEYTLKPGGISAYPAKNGEIMSCEEVVDELRRLRISQLRRMADTAAAWGILAASESGGVDLSKYELTIRNVCRLERFYNACRAEIERLRGEG